MYLALWAFRLQCLLTPHQVQKFVDEECIPADAVFEAQCAEGGRWTLPPIMDELKRKGQELGLWNMFLPKGHYNEGAGFTNVEYGLMCEYFGKSRTASEVCWRFLVS